MNLMEWFSQLIKHLADLLGALGVPEAYRTITALGVVYILATLIVIGVIVGLWSLTRPKRKPPVEKPAEKEEPLEQEAPPPEAEEAAPAEEVSEEIEKPEAPEVYPPEVPLPPAEEEAVAEVPAEEVPAERPISLFDRMRTGLSKTQSALVGRVDALLGGRQKIDEDLLEDLEEILITADFGMKTTQEFIQALEQRIEKGKATDPAALRDILREEIRARLQAEAGPLDLDGNSPFVLMVVGVNGVGKTTTIGKLAHQFASQGKRVILGAGDTFRAAAAEQLTVWGQRAGVEVIRHAEGADPAAVAFDAAKAAVARKADILILDTAGRLHTKVNLMEELKKIRRVLAREIPGAPHETLLVLDATTGQNALSQARLFRETVEVSGIALTKLDGTAKGGIVVAIGAELDLPVRFVGIGEGLEDLRPFDPDLFVDALFQKG